MPSKLTEKQRLKLVERAIRGEEVPSLCQEFGISRTLLYRWINRYKEGQGKNKMLALKPRKRRVPLFLRTSPEKVRLILETVRHNPEFSVVKITQALPRGSTGSPLIGCHGVQKVLERLDLNTIEKRQNYQKQPQILQDYKSVRMEALGFQSGDISPQDRLAMIERVKLGESVARISKLYGVSRTILYSWLKRYDEAPEGKKLEALWDRKPKVEKYFNQAPREYEQAVLSAVREYPELSSHMLVHVLPKIGERPILGNHGVQNVLQRHDLTLYEKRLVYSKAYHQQTLLSHFFEIPKIALSHIGSLAPSARKYAVRGSLVTAIGIFAGVVIYGATSLAGIFTAAPTFSFSFGMIFALISLIFGMFFFVYSLKYYFTIAAVLSFSRRSLEEKIEKTRGSFWSNFFNVANDNHNNNTMNSNQPIFAGGLQPDLSKIVLDRKPFVSIHLATYNEKRVIDRLLTAVTAMEYENYEVVLVDDSTDETIEILKKWADHPRVKIIHRDSRDGYKGKALNVALKNTSPKAEFVLIFDADFIPYSDTVVQFLKYFYSLTGGLGLEEIRNTKIAAVQGYQWHVLNKSENWITRGVRSEYSGSYVMERSGIEIYKGLKQIAGSVYMMRADVLRELNWGTSITEDFELTLKLYEQGYKVVYTPYIQAPAEAVSTIRRLIKQRMRWAEGHSHNVKKMFFRLLKSPKLTLPEKLEFLYLSPYYLQALLFILGSFSWFLAEVVFRVRLPFWTEVWGWSLILTNMLALPLMNMVGLFLEEAEEKDYLGLFSFVVLSYVVAPFQGYAAIKGFLSKEEGPWFRTPKTGKITDVFTPGRFYRFILGVLGRPPAILPTRLKDTSGGPAVANIQAGPCPAFALTASCYKSGTANEMFNSFNIRPKKTRWLGRMVLSVLLILTVSLYSVTRGVPEVLATNVNNYYAWSSTTDEDAVDLASALVNAGLSMRGVAAGGTNTSLTVKFNTSQYWYSRQLPTGTINATIPSGDYLYNNYVVSLPTGTKTITWKVVMGYCQGGAGDACGTGATYTPLATSSNITYTARSLAGLRQEAIGNLAGSITCTSADRCRVYVLVSGVSSSQGGSFDLGYNGSAADYITNLLPPSAIVVPENIFLFAVFAPFITMFIFWLEKRKNNPFPLKLRRVQ